MIFLRFMVMIPTSYPENIKCNPKIPLVRLALLQPFVDYLDRNGVDSDKVLTTNGLVRESLLDPDVFVPVIVIHRFLEEGAVAAGDPFFGVHVGERLDLATWPPFVDAASHAKTLGEFLIRFIRAAQDEASSAKHCLEVGNLYTSFKEVRITLQVIPPAQNDGFTAAYTLRLLRRGAGNDWKPGEVELTVCDTAALPERYLGVSVSGGDWMGISIRFPTEWLFCDVATKTLVQSSVSRKDALKVPKDFMDALRQAITLHIQNPELNLGQVSALVGISRQSLQRHLKMRGTTFTAEVNSAKRLRAAELLKTTNQAISEIACAVGFIDSTAFARAFKSWTGESPRVFRKNERMREG